MNLLRDYPKKDGWIHLKLTLQHGAERNPENVIGTAKFLIGPGDVSPVIFTRRTAKVAVRPKQKQKPAHSRTNHGSEIVL